MDGDATGRAGDEAGLHTGASESDIADDTHSIDPAAFLVISNQAPT